MPRNVDAFALFFIVMIVLVAGYFADHAPLCLSDGVRVGVVDDRGIGVLAPPQLPDPPAAPHLVSLPQL